MEGLLKSLVVSVLFAWICIQGTAAKMEAKSPQEMKLQQQQQQQHDGVSVTRMLAKMGLGPAGSKLSWKLKPCGLSRPCLTPFSEGQTEGAGGFPSCWGYEKGCTEDIRLFVPQCEGSASPWAKDMKGKHEQFWIQGDFGYVKKEVDSMMTLCKLKKKGDSSLTCSENLRHCRAQNLYIDFRRFREMSNTEGRYTSFLEDIFKRGEIGGHCEFNAEAHGQQGAHKSPLQSWYAELEMYTSLEFRPTSEEHCDEIITRPTIFIKLDAGVNLYHHYCDFFNLFASQHINGSFQTDVNIVMWDTSYRPYFDLFSDTWKAFTDHPIQRLSDFEGKRVCFREALFPLLARMRHGLYYNTYLLPDCHGSGLMQAFSKHLLARLNIKQDGDAEPERVRVTLLSRSTKHRRIVNQDQLVNALKTVNFFDVRVVDYKAKVYPFLDQLKSSHNSDIFMGMHGSGLTHLLFLPDWGGAFEIYNTEDPRCYYDLARLRGIPYITWEDDEKVYAEAEGKHPQHGTHHAKFTNYSFDVEEFMRLSLLLGEKVRERKISFLSKTAKTKQYQHYHHEL